MRCRSRSNALAWRISVWPKVDGWGCWECVEGAFTRTNLSAQGGAAMAGTSWPVNRVRVAPLLGHDGLVVNSADAGGFARDHMEEGVACLAVLMSNVGRLATHLFV
jgi:argininosuccinate lyase